MRTIIKDKRYFRVLCVTILPLALMFMGCTDELNRNRTGNTTDKMVMVSLQVNIPPVINPKSKSESTGVVKALSRSGNDSSFAVTLEQGQERHTATTRVSDGTTKLYNLWLFQFNGDGSIRGKPHKISDEATAINDMVTIDVPLAVAENQTLYLVALGPKLDYDMSEVIDLSNLEEQNFEYLTSIGGHTESLITTDDEVPFAGKASGVTIVDIDEGNRGLVEYNKPADFVGGIEIRRLMARVTLRYKFEVEDYKLQGLKLLNVNSTIRLTNPETNTDADTYATLEVDKPGTADANGFYSVTWYVAQNCQGTVESILSENQRYHKVVNGVSSGDAPVLGTQIEAWAYSTLNTSEYAIYQMYVGNNNINNFDVTPNHYYNLRTSINADINSAKNDERIRAYSATQYVEFHASNNMSVSGGASFDRFKYNKNGKDYDLDAAYDVRPIVVQTQGRTVEVGIYTDDGCTQQAAPTQSWLRLSSSSNYTEAYNNAKEPLDTHITASTILPTQVFFYLYNDEYVYDGNNEFVDPGYTDAEGKRSLYIKITTTVNGDEGILQASHIFRLDQRPAVYLGCFGGERMEDGSYTMGLVYDRLAARRADRYLEDIKPGTISGRYGLQTAPLGYGTDDMDNGKTATRHLAENTYNLNWNISGLPIPRKNASGHVLLYQYQYPANTFGARVCYDKNRDENGNGIIDEEEFKWYLPASNQLLGLCAGFIFDMQQIFGGSTTEYVLAPPYNDIYFKEITGGGGLGNGGSSGRCVRNVPLPSSAPY